MAQNTIGTAGIIRDARSRYRTAQREEGGAHGAFEGETRRSGGEPRAEVTVSRAEAPADVAELLAVEGAAVLRARRMFVGEDLVQLVNTWIPVDVAEAAGVESVDTGAGGIISRMAEAGFSQGSEAVEDVDQRPATADQAAALGVEEGELLLTVTHVGRTAEGRAVEVTRHTLGRGWTLRYAVPLD
ncbi:MULTISPECIES: UTRA domain-containing protein [unclassified Streptomyces]|uniref:UTRA domain-containing protein n=1 Tax=Streptomyces sp. NBC_00078 TaxID=2975643 RepID=UPI0022528BED|nr:MULTISPECIES: UTRA domain-containing protein [unclassified Streptomyces]MCX5426113.1 UTRA domain-containing protein [Streptomyces sp. NBC_00078]MCY1649238.1 UTRA domain-containing protein [Streptomyces sp. SL203]